MMRNLMTLLAAASFLLLGGCAATAPTSDDTVKFHVSERADKLIAEQGKAVASIRGYDRDSELVCERWTKTGSHISHNVCYTRAEMEQRRLNHQEESRRLTAPGATCMEGPTSLGGSPEQFRGAAGGC